MKGDWGNEQGTRRRGEGSPQLENHAMTRVLVGYNHRKVAMGNYRIEGASTGCQHQEASGPLVHWISGKGTWGKEERPEAPCKGGLASRGSSKLGPRCDLEPMGTLDCAKIGGPSRVSQA